MLQVHRPKDPHFPESQLGAATSKRGQNISRLQLQEADFFTFEQNQASCFLQFQVFVLS